jgi:hypothetical protein
MSKNNILCDLLGIKKIQDKNLSCDCGKDVYSCVYCPSAQYEYTEDYPLLKFDRKYSFERLVDILVSKFGIIKIFYSLGKYHIHMGNKDIQGSDEDKYECLYEHIANLIKCKQLSPSEVR